MQTNYALLEAIATQIRRDSIRSTTKAGSGHPTTCCSAAEIMAVLFFNTMRYDPQNAKCPNADRFVLSKGHAAPALYACWKVAGICTDADVMSLREKTSSYEGHPTPRLPFVDVATGSLGQGLGAGIGIAWNAAKLDKTGYRTYVLLGDGETAEGAVWEAAAFASHYKMDNICAIVDLNRLGQSQQTMLEHDANTMAARWSAFGWNALIVDGHECKALCDAFDTAAKTKDKPTVIVAKTFKGRGVAFAENKDNWHGKPFSKEQAEEALKMLPALTPEQQTQVTIAKPPVITAPAKVVELDKYAPCTLKEGDMIPTREQYGISLSALGTVASNVVVLDAETKNSTYSNKFMQTHPERFVECYIAEQNMVSIAAGLSSRDKVPFVSTFGAFLSRAFDQIRMAGISQNNVKFCGSHVGISIGEDGPSQMALEDIATFRTIPNSVVLYPSDAIAMDAAVRLAYDYKGIVYLRATRPKTPVIYKNTEKFELGISKVVRQTKDDKLTVVGGGLTLLEALKAADNLAKEGISIRVVDVFSIKPLDVKTLSQCAKDTNNSILVVEDHYLAGGITETVATALSPLGITVDGLYVKGIPHSGKPAENYAWAGIDANGIIKKVKEMI